MTSDQAREIAIRDQAREIAIRVLREVDADALVFISDEVADAREAAAVLEAQANVEEKKAARLERVWAVHYGNYSPSEVESIWATEELARAHCASLDGSMWEVSWFEVRYALVEASRESAT